MQKLFSRLGDGWATELIDEVVMREVRDDRNIGFITIICGIRSARFKRGEKVLIEFSPKDCHLLPWDNDYSRVVQE